MKIHNVNVMGWSPSLTTQQHSEMRLTRNQRIGQSVRTSRKVISSLDFGACSPLMLSLGDKHDGVVQLAVVLRSVPEATCFLASCLRNSDARLTWVWVFVKWNHSDEYNYVWSNWLCFPSRNTFTVGDKLSDFGSERSSKDLWRFCKC
jgi:hypothetical protein